LGNLFLKLIMKLKWIHGLLGIQCYDRASGVVENIVEEILMFLQRGISVILEVWYSTVCKLY